MKHKMRALSLCFLFVLSGCAGTKDRGTAVDTDTAPVFTPASFSALEGWSADGLQGFMEAYARSCARIAKREPLEKFGADPIWGVYGDWQKPCSRAANLDGNNPAGVRAFLEENFRVVGVSAGGKSEGLFTGYYESTLKGSRTRGGPYQHPLLARPDDLVMVELGEFRDELKGQRIAGRVSDGKLKPYEDRAAIVSGKLSPEDFTPLVWLDSPYDAFFVQVQGSGIVHLAEGGVMRVGYAGQNGHPYYAIGRELVKRGVYTKYEVSMESIRRWMEQNPQDADELMNTNPSYVFFTELKGLGADDGPKGGEGVSLTAGRSLAIDRGKFPYGFPVYLIADYTDEKERPIRKLMMVQDTGGAIRGAVRGDYFWGGGEMAEAKAGPMKAKGRYFFLMPKT